MKGISICILLLYLLRVEGSSAVTDSGSGTKADNENIASTVEPFTVSVNVGDANTPVMTSVNVLEEVDSPFDVELNRLDPDNEEQLILTWDINSDPSVGFDITLEDEFGVEADHPSVDKDKREKNFTGLTPGTMYRAYI